MSVINTNTKALVAQNAITANNRAMSKSMEQLSTGQRINSAADDAAGLAISSRMTSYMKGLDQAVRNANDGISLLQTAEGAMDEITNMLQRMRELSIQSGNDTNTSTDRGYLQLEFSSLRDQITSVAATTQWNGMGILNGANNGSGAGVFTFQVGATNSAEQRIEHTITAMTGAAGAGTTTIAATGSALAEAATKQASVSVFTNVTAGEIINFQIGDQKISYTVTAADAADAAAAGGTSLMVQNMRAAINSNATVASFAAATASVNNTDTLTITAAANGAPFSFSATSAANGNALVPNSASISTAANARTATDTVTTALTTVNNARAGLGATINRLTYTADNVANISQNTAASRSRILDTDYASATTELARTQIISQAATAMLAQANQASQGVLALLR
jgi:flagellin